jgi:aminopeptidase-like protein
MSLVSEIDSYLKELFPIARSITGLGNRESLKILQRIAPLQVEEYKSGKSVYDWIIPDEWNVKDAWIKDSFGNKIIDYKECNIHIVGYSIPVHTTMNFKELRPKLFYDNRIPDSIPYRTSYYHKDYGFCVTKKQYEKLKSINTPLEIKIESELDPNGSMTIGELLIPGASKQEILISTYFCHPQLANDNLSGFLMTAFLARKLLEKKDLKYSYRIVWVPETIGAISYCSVNEKQMKDIDMGLVITTVGGSGSFGYKQSFNIEHPINRIVESTFMDSSIDFIKYQWDIHGSDERQYSSKAFSINTITISKDKYYEYPQYHTSSDDLSLVNGSQIYDSLKIYLQLIEKFENRVLYKNTNPYCEAFLSKHDLYPKEGGTLRPKLKGKSEVDVILWLLFLCDGSMSVEDISLKIGIDKEIINDFSIRLENKGLLKKV